MPRFLRRLFKPDRVVRLNRLVKLAAEMDELLITRNLAPASRNQLQAGREDLERRIRDLLVA